MRKIDLLRSALDDERAEIAAYVRSAGGTSRIEGIHLARHDPALDRMIKHFAGAQALSKTQVTIAEANTDDDAMLAWARICAPWYSDLDIDGPVDLFDACEMVRRRRNLDVDDYHAALAQVGPCNRDLVLKMHCAFKLRPAERAVIADYVDAIRTAVEPKKPAPPYTESKSRDSIGRALIDEEPR